MNIIFHEQSRTFHLYNDKVSYIMMVLKNEQLGNLYYGKRIHDREDFSYLFEIVARPMSSCVFKGDRQFCLEHIKQEYAAYGTGDYRQPAIEIVQENGSRIVDLCYEGYEISAGKPELSGLPATYTESDDEAMTLCISLRDKLTNVVAKLYYTIFRDYAVIARSVKICNEGSQSVDINRAMSLCLDLPDCKYEWLQFSGAWARERHIKNRKLTMGIQSIGSMRGNSSHEHNPFMVLKRPDTNEDSGTAIGFSFIYSGNFLIQAEVDAHDVTRVLVGIHPDTFDWHLSSGEEFQTPEAVMVFSDSGMNDMSQTLHKLYAKRLARGYWRDKARPILINNWEATYFDFTEEKLVAIAEKAKECGVELFVLDDGWFGARRNDYAGLGDWVANKELLPNGIKGLSERIEDLGMRFGLWFEPEMVNEDSDLYRLHPDWVLATPERSKSHGRNQFVLDFSRQEVVDTIYEMMAEILSNSKVSYIKWDMNRSITECYSSKLAFNRQQEVFHRYILGVYSLYERLIRSFPEVLFESCSSGGGRFDPGMLYYAPQAWCSDDSDAAERMKIQYGTTYAYPISSIGSHVSVTPNHQVNRITPLHTRANVAYFGTFGYELDLNKLSDEEIEEVKEQIAFMKEYRQLIQFGTFYRLQSPFDTNEMCWMVVSEDKRTAIVGWYRVLNPVNGYFTRMHLKGLNPELLYHEKTSNMTYYGDELMNAGLITTDASAGEFPVGSKVCTDFESRIYILEAE